MAALPVALKEIPLRVSANDRSWREAELRSGARHVGCRELSGHPYRASGRQ